jgi:hypothetical protein
MPNDPPADPDVVSGRPVRLSQKDDRAAFGAMVVRNLKDNVSPDQVSEVITNALGARMYDRLGRDVGPDHKTALRAAEMYIHHTVGLPVQRLETVVSKTSGTDSDVLERILASPAARKTLGKILSKFNDTPDKKQ